MLLHFEKWLPVLAVLAVLLVMVCMGLADEGAVAHESSPGPLVGGCHVRKFAAWGRGVGKIQVYPRCVWLPLLVHTLYSTDNVP